MVLRDSSSNTLEKAWAIMDKQKVGFVNIDDYRKALVDCGVYLSKSELSFSFNFIDKS